MYLIRVFSIQYLGHMYFRFRIKVFRLGFGDFCMLQVFLCAIYFLRFSRIQALGFFLMLFRFKVYGFVEFKVQILGIRLGLNIFYDLYSGLQDLGFLMVQGIGFIIQCFRFVFRICRLRVLCMFQCFICLWFRNYGFFFVVWFHIQDLWVDRVQSLEFLCFKGFSTFQGFKGLVIRMAFRV